MQTDKNKKIEEIMKRKEEHIKICLDKPVQAKQVSTLFECMHFINNSLPEFDMNEVDLSSKFLGHNFSAPLMIGAMTGGAELAKKINGNLAKAAEKLGLGVAVGSQRAGLYDKRLADTYSITRKNAPTAFIGANIGGAQLSKGFTVKEAQQLVDMLDADALYIHLNPVQEVVQPEGEPRYKNVLKNIGQIASGIDKPVVVKEVGFGISGEVAAKLEKAGVSAIEVAGMGGTSYSAVEYYRALDFKINVKAQMGNLFWDWGIPTAASLHMVRNAVKIPVVASGGIRNGEEMAKAIAMGADLCAAAWPFLRPATISSEKVAEKLNELIAEIRATMFITGCKNIEELKKSGYVITGELKDWIHNKQ